MAIFHYSVLRMIHRVVLLRTRREIFSKSIVPIYQLLYRDTNDNYYKHEYFRRATNKSEKHFGSDGVYTNYRRSTSIDTMHDTLHCN